MYDFSRFAQHHTVERLSQTPRRNTESWHRLVLTLTEYRLRTALAERGEELAGLNPASRTQSTACPTTERVLDAFTSITLPP
jgi:hypothetical protein